MRGFGHVGFLVQDLDAACAYLEEQGVTFKKKPAEGNMRGANSSFSLYNFLILRLRLTVFTNIFLVCLRIGLCLRPGWILGGNHSERWHLNAGCVV